MLNKFRKYYNEKYESIAVYVTGTALVILVLGLLVLWISGKVPAIISFTGAVLKPLILGLCLTYLLSPLTAKIETKVLGGIKKPESRRLIAVLITILIAFLAVTAVLSVIIATVTKSLSVVNLSDMKTFFLSLADQFENFQTTIESALEKMNINIGSVSTLMGKLFSGVKSAASTMLFAVIFSIYFLYDRNIGRYWAGVLKAVSSESAREKMRSFAADANKVFSGYIRGQALDALLVGIMASIALFVAGVPYALVIGILTGLGNLIPYVGPVVGFGSLILVCLAESAFTKLIIGGIVLLAVMFIDGNVINPRMLSASVEVHPVLVIVALLAGGRIGGVVGMLVSVPVAALIKIQFEKLIKSRTNYDPASYAPHGDGEDADAGDTKDDDLPEER